MKKYIVTLTEEERQGLQEMLSRGKTAARKLPHARILLKADAAPGGPDWHDDAIAEALDAALERRPTRRQYRRKLDGDGGGPPDRLGVSEAAGGA